MKAKKSIDKSKMPFGRSKNVGKTRKKRQNREQSKGSKITKKNGRFEKAGERMELIGKLYEL